MQRESKKDKVSEFFYDLEYLNELTQKLSKQIFCELLFTRALRPFKGHVKAMWKLVRRVIRGICEGVFRG